MGHKKIDCGPPVELSGPYILNKIMRRCSVCPECGKKTNWLGARNDSGVYPIKIGPKTHSVRRVVYELSGGRLRDQGKLITTCDNHRCIDFEKLQQVTMKHIVREASRQGKLMTLATVAKIAAIKRRTQGKITQEAAEQIRLDTRSSPKVAAEYGVSDSYVRAIRAGRSRRDFTPSPFAGLGAR